jgi:periplasmic protein TonB
VSKHLSGWHRRFKEDFEMFDKLVASEPESADFKNRRRYFVTSSVVVGVLFLAAVVASIFAADFGLGNGSFELTQMLSPVEMAAVEPETPQPQRQNNQTQTSNLPTRTANIPRIDESPTVIPTTTSTTRNTEAVRPNAPFIPNARFNSDPAGGGSSGRETSTGVPSGGGLRQTERVAENEELEQAPPREIKKPRPTISKGPLNGYAKSLPKPAYTAAAKSVRAQGSVMVQVIIDERGNVVSANAMNGHPMLRGEAEKAARAAKFSPTILGDAPVKVTGVITYNFIL